MGAIPRKSAITFSLTADVIKRQLETAADVTAAALSLVLTGGRDPQAAAAADAGQAAGAGPPARKDAVNTFTLWTYRASDSARGCEFCKSLDGKEVLTYDGQRPNSLAVPNPLCNWPPHCKCWFDMLPNLTEAELDNYPNAIRDYLGN